MIGIECFCSACHSQFLSTFFAAQDRVTARGGQSHEQKSVCHTSSPQNCLPRFRLFPNAVQKAIKGTEN